MTRRYEEYPQLARLVRAMSDEGRELVAHWNLVLLRALEGYVPKAREQAREALADQPDLDEATRAIAEHGVAIGLAGWATVMREVGALIVDPSGDWCCKRGMLAHPDPCPQHGFDVRVLYYKGTVIERKAVSTTSSGVDAERAIRVESGAGDRWVSITTGEDYRQASMASSEWRVVGRA